MTYRELFKRARFAWSALRGIPATRVVIANARIIMDESSRSSVDGWGEMVFIGNIATGTIEIGPDIQVRSDSNLFKSTVNTKGAE